MSTDSAGCFPFLPLGCPGTPTLLECSGSSSRIPCTQISCCHRTTKGPSETCPLQEFCAITNFKGRPLGQHMVPEQLGLNIKADGEHWTRWQTTGVDQILGLVPSSQGGVLQPSNVKWEAVSCYQGLEGTLADTSTGEWERKILDNSADKRPLRKQQAGGAGLVVRHSPLPHPEQRQAVSPLRIPPRLPEPIHTQPGNAQEAAACLPGSRLTCWAGQDPARGLILKAQSRAILELLPS